MFEISKSPRGNGITAEMLQAIGEKLNNYIQMIIEKFGEKIMPMECKVVINGRM